jgi:hypothetical protein
MDELRKPKGSLEEVEVEADPWPDHTHTHTMDTMDREMQRGEQETGRG